MKLFFINLSILAFFPIAFFMLLFVTVLSGVGGVLHIIKYDLIPLFKRIYLRKKAYIEGRAQALSIFFVLAFRKSIFRGSTPSNRQRLSLFDLPQAYQIETLRLTSARGLSPQKGNVMSKGIKGRGKIHSTSRSWEKSLKKVAKAKDRQKAKKLIRKQGG